MPAPPTAELTLPIEGMTCASCVNRVERFLRRRRRASRRTSTSRPRTATVRYDPTSPVGTRGARAPSRRPATTSARPSRWRTRRSCRSLAAEPLTPNASAPASPRGLLVRALVVDRRGGRDDGRHVLAATRRAAEQLNLLVLRPGDDRPVRAGWRFYAAAWRAARHRTANMSTLVVLGTTAAWAYSRGRDAVARAGHGGRHRADDVLRQRRGDHRPRPAGRWLEARAKWPRPARCGASSGFSRGRRASCATATRGRTCRSQTSQPATSFGCGRASASRSTASWSRAHRRRRVDAHRRGDAGRQGRRRRGDRGDA